MKFLISLVLLLSVTVQAGDPVIWYGNAAKFLPGPYNGVLKTSNGVVAGSSTTTDVPEGSNLYFTNGRFNTQFATKTTTDLTEGTNLYYTPARFNTAFAAKTTTDLTEGANLYYTTARFNTAFAAKTTTDLTEGTNLYYTPARFNSAFAGKTTTDLTEGTNLYFTNARSRLSVSATSPLLYNNGTGIFSIQPANTSQSGYLTVTDWNIFNNKQDKSSSNFITNPDAETNTVGWNLYNDQGRTVPANVINQDITYTSALSGAGGNGATVSYTFCGSSYVGPIVTCPSGTSVQVCWYNGPTISQNPSATVLKAAYDAQSCATAIATSAITGTASHLQYITGTSTLGGGGDTSPTDGTGGAVTGLTFTRNTSTPLIGTASFDLGKDAANREGEGVSTDFQINSVDLGKALQISFVYQGSSGMTLGAGSDVQVFLYDVTNAAFIPITPLNTIAGPVNTAKQFEAQFTASGSSVNYRLILHTATTNATAWDFLLDSVVVNDELSPQAATQVPSLVLAGEPISGAVTDHMVVMWKDGATQWVPATIAGAALPTFGDDVTQLGFATNIVGSVADIYIRGYMGGFSFGPFTGYEQYIDNTAGAISPLPSPFNDMYVITGIAISSTALNIQFSPHVPLVSSAGIPIKGGLLTSSAVNDGTGDVVLSPGANGAFLVANSAAARGLNYRVLASADIPNNAANTTGSAATLTTSRTIAGSSFNGSANITLANKFIVQGTADAGLSGPQFLGALATGLVKNTTTTGVLSIAAASDTTGVALTGFVSGAGTVTSADTILTAFNKINGNDLLKAPIASPTFTGIPAAPTAAANTSTTQLATTAFVTTADNLKAPLASPTFTGDVNSSTGNVLISTIGKGLQVKTGTNAKIGQATLVGGTKTVANTSVTANSRIFLSVSATGGTPSTLSYTKINATSFTITSANVLDTSTIDWFIVESIP